MRDASWQSGRRDGVDHEVAPVEPDLVSREHARDDLGCDTGDGSVADDLVTLGHELGESDDAIGDELVGLRIELVRRDLEEAE